jgi:putative transposase
MAWTADALERACGVSDAIIRGWRASLYPTGEQGRLLSLYANHARGLWNKLLGEVVRRYEADQTFLWRADLQRLVVAWKRQPETAWVAELPAHAALDVCARLDGALSRMVRERRAGRRCGFPRFRKKRWGEGMVYFVNQATRLEAGGRRVRLPKLGQVRLRGGDVPAGKLLSSRAVRDGDRWMLSAQFECPRLPPLPATGVRLGVDAGLSSLATVFDGEAFEHVAAPKPLRKAAKRLRRAQRRVARRQKGSARRRVAVKRVAAIHRRVCHVRADHMHKLTHRLTAKADALHVETLDVRAMSRGLRLGKSVADAAIGTMLRQVAYKADWRGRKLVAADKWFASTKTCCRCGERHAMPLSQRTMRCACGNVMDRDENAAVNLYWYGEEPRNRALLGATRVETGCQAAGVSLLPVPVVETRMLAVMEHASDHECQ